MYFYAIQLVLLYGIIYKEANYMVGTMKHIQQRGFTIVEILLVIVVMGIIGTLVYSNFAGSKQKSYEAKAQGELSSIASSIELYVTKYNAYPTPASPGIPSGIKEFAKDGSGGATWTAAPWPNSYYDYNAWDIDTSTPGIDTVQVAVRFCTAAQASNCPNQKPKTSWGTNFTTNLSAFYYCIKGYCRPSDTQPTTYPGYCINCPGNTGIKYPGES